MDSWMYYNWPNDYYLSVPVDQCPTLSIPAHGAVSTKLTDYGIVVEVKCDTGYHFVDGTTSLAIECVANSQWNVTMQECQGAILGILHFYV